MGDPRKIDFIGIGATRSGTTWLSECLRQHPDVRFPRPPEEANAGQPLGYLNLKDEKELDFFIVGVGGNAGGALRSTNDRGLAWYLDQFPPAGPGKIRGEFSPAYMLDEQCAGRIRLAFPEVKLIAALRNPADMVYSLFWFDAYAVMRDDLTFEQAADRGHYLERGLYHRQLRPFYEAFPREQIHVVLYDDIQKDPAKVVSDLYGFLGVRQDFVPPSVRRKVNAFQMTRSGLLKSSAKGAVSLLKKIGLGALADRLISDPALFRLYCRLNLGRGGKYPPMGPGTKQRLRSFFRGDILELQKLIGRDLGAWLR